MTTLTTAQSSSNNPPSQPGPPSPGTAFFQQLNSSRNQQTHPPSPEGDEGLINVGNTSTDSDHQPSSSQRPSHFYSAATRKKYNIPLFLEK